MSTARRCCAVTETSEYQPRTIGQVARGASSRAACVSRLATPRSFNLGIKNAYKEHLNSRKTRRAKLPAGLRIATFGLRQAPDAWRQAIAPPR